LLVLLYEYITKHRRMNIKKTPLFAQSNQMALHNFKNIQHEMWCIRN